MCVYIIRFTFQAKTTSTQCLFLNVTFKNFQQEQYLTTKHDELLNK